MKKEEIVSTHLSYIESAFDLYILDVTDLLALYSEHKGMEELIAQIGEEQLNLPSIESKRFKQQAIAAKNHFEQISANITPVLNGLCRTQPKERSNQLLEEVLSNDLTIKDSFGYVIKFWPTAKKQTEKNSIEK